MNYIRYLLIRKAGIFLLPLLLSVAVSSGGSWAPAGAPPEAPFLCGTPKLAMLQKDVKIIVTNDVHGYIFQDGKNGRIGYAVLRGYVDSLRNRGFAVYLMDAGDAFSGNAVAQFDAGRSVAEAMGKVGYRVLAPGNHAFDYNRSEDDPLYYSRVLLQTLAANSAGEMDAVCLNMSYRGQPVPGVSAQPLPLLERYDMRVIVCGIITPYVASKSNSEGVRDYDFGLVTKDGKPDHAETRSRLLALLESAVRPYGEPEDVVVVLSHVGFDSSADYRQGQVSGRDFATVANVDAVVDAHSHNVSPAEKIGTTWYSNAGRYLENFAEITITSEGALPQIAMEIKGYADIASVPADTPTLESLRAVSDRLGLGERLANLVDSPGLSDRNINSESTPLGRFLCRQMRAITGADLALYNSGGIRSGLGPGWITAGDLYDMIPFQNNLLTMTMTGRSIDTFFQTLPERGTNAFPQLYGMKAYAWERGDGGLGIAGIADGKGGALDPDRVYSVAVNSFMAFGGDDYSFPGATVSKDYGDCVRAIVLSLKTRGSPMLPGAFYEDNPLLVFPTRDEAERAWRERGAEVGR